MCPIMELWSGWYHSVVFCEPVFREPGRDLEEIQVSLSLFGILL